MIEMRRKDESEANRGWCPLLRSAERDVVDTSMAARFE
jgi:hypothetical protein